MNRAELTAHIEAIEKAYEFFLSYAAQGATDDAAVNVSGQLRQFLGDADTAIRALETDLSSIIAAEDLKPADIYRDVIDVTSRDAAAAGAALRVVVAQGTISSQLIDNLNASMHMRALLTDLFLLDDVV